MALDRRLTLIEQAMAPGSPPLVMHVVHRLDVGGLENGVVNLINHMPAGAYRHVVVALTEATDFRHRIRHHEVPVFAMHKPPGHGIWLYPALYRLIRRLQPAIVHSRNLAALEAQVPAWAAGVPIRIHGEHGRDVDDLIGASRKHQWLRRLYRPAISHYVALGRDLSEYLVAKVGVGPADLTAIYNGVDTAHFVPAAGPPERIPDCPFNAEDHWLIGTVGRMQAVKDQPALTRAFVTALRQEPALRQRARLVMVGDGPLRAESMLVLESAGMAELAWFPGMRGDIADVMRGLHCFVLPSLAEGVSNTILEAMASGLPVIATDVGANAELVQDGKTGVIVPARNEQALAGAMARLASEPERAAAMGRAGRALAESRFSLAAMVGAYRALYDRQLAVRSMEGRVAPRSG